MKSKQCPSNVVTWDQLLIGGGVISMVFVLIYGSYSIGRTSGHSAGYDEAKEEWVTYVCKTEGKKPAPFYTRCI